MYRMGLEPLSAFMFLRRNVNLCRLRKRCMWTRLETTMSSLSVKSNCSELHYKSRRKVEQTSSCKCNCRPEGKSRWPCRHSSSFKCNCRPEGKSRCTCRHSSSCQWICPGNVVMVIVRACERESDRIESNRIECRLSSIMSFVELAPSYVPACLQLNFLCIFFSGKLAKYWVVGSGIYFRVLITLWTDETVSFKYYHQNTVSMVSMVSSNSVGDY